MSEEEELRNIIEDVVKIVYRIKNEATKTNKNMSDEEILQRVLQEIKEREKETKSMQDIKEREKETKSMQDIDKLIFLRDSFEKKLANPPKGYTTEMIGKMIDDCNEEIKRWSKIAKDIPTIKKDLRDLQTEHLLLIAQKGIDNGFNYDKEIEKIKVHMPSFDVEYYDGKSPASMPKPIDEHTPVIPKKPEESITVTPKEPKETAPVTPKVIDTPTVDKKETTKIKVKSGSLGINIIREIEVNNEDLEKVFPNGTYDSKKQYPDNDKRIEILVKAEKNRKAIEEAQQKLIAAQERDSKYISVEIPDVSMNAPKGAKNTIKIDPSFLDKDIFPEGKVPDTEHRTYKQQKAIIEAWGESNRQRDKEEGFFRGKSVDNLEKKVQRLAEKDGKLTGAKKEKPSFRERITNLFTKNKKEVPKEESVATK